MRSNRLICPRNFIKQFLFRRFFRHLRNVSLDGDANKPNIEFTADGDLKSTELKIMNLRPSVNSKNIVWEEVYTTRVSIINSTIKSLNFIR